MLTSLEETARTHALTASARSIFVFSPFFASLFLHSSFSGPISAPWLILVSVGVPTLILLLIPIEKIADILLKHLKPKGPERQFKNVVEEIAIALGEPVESIQIYPSPIANVIVLPCIGQEVVVATEGALQELNRYELQALVAAQFAGMRDRWCRLATRAEIMWWALPWLMIFLVPSLLLGFAATAMVCFLSVFVAAFVPRWNEQARDLCADVVAVRTTFDPASLGSALRKLAEHANKSTDIKFGKFYLPTNPFLVVPRRVASTTTVSSTKGSRKWSSKDEVRMELLLRADRAEALAKGADPSDFTGREFSKRWRALGRKPD